MDVPDMWTRERCESLNDGDECLFCKEIPTMKKMTMDALVDDAEKLVGDFKLSRECGVWVAGPHSYRSIGHGLTPRGAIESMIANRRWSDAYEAERAAKKAADEAKENAETKTILSLDPLVVVSGDATAPANGAGAG